MDDILNTSPATNRVAASRCIQWRHSLYGVAESIVFSNWCVFEILHADRQTWRSPIRDRSVAVLAFESHLKDEKTTR
jgi:hypothetical protein